MTVNSSRLLLSRRRPILLLPIVALSFLALPLQAQVINEFVANHTGTDSHEFVEVAGLPSTDLSALTVVQIEGDASNNPGNLDSAEAVGSTDANGIWVGAFTNNVLHNGTMTLLLVEGYSGTVDTDLDTNDDGVLDLVPWTSVIDSVGVGDGDAGDHNYLADTVLLANFDGISFVPGGASRIPNGTDTDSVGDWTRNDFSGEGLPGFDGFLDPGEALNTPGAVNSTAAAPGSPPRINEVVADHTGVDSAEFVEIFGSPLADYSAFWAVVLDAGGTVASAIQLGTTNGTGLWVSPLSAGELPDSSISVLLVEDWSGTVGADLDPGDDGTLDTQPWTTVHDGLAFDHGLAMEQVYAATVLGPGYDGMAGAPGGASRYPTGVDTGSSADWLRNDFDGTGLPGFLGASRAVDAGEAENTPGTTNLAAVVSYYQSVDLSDATTLRTTLHELIDDHVRHPYSAADTDTWDILELADEDPLDPARVLTLYKNAPYTKVGGGNSDYNREHTWPRTFGFPDNTADSSPYTDCHQLRLADIDYNSDRGSRIFGSCDFGCLENPTDVHNGQGGGTGVYPGNSNWFTAADGVAGRWETWGHRRGDVARTMLYLDLRYAGGSHGATGFAEPNLVLTDDDSLISGSGSNTTGTAYMGLLSTLLAWHAADPVDEGERLRNQVVYRFQGNRNPFVDHPEWVSCIFTGASCETGAIFDDDFETGDTDAWTAVLGR